MSRRISIKNHLSMADLITRYHQAKDPIEKSRFLIICLLLEEKSINEVAEIMKCTSQAIYKLVNRYNRDGLKAMRNLRRENTGRPENALLNDRQKELLWIALQSPPPKGERWNGVLVAQWISEEIGRNVPRQTGSRYFREMRSRLRRPVTK